MKDHVPLAWTLFFPILSPLTNFISLYQEAYSCSASCRGLGVVDWLKHLREPIGCEPQYVQWPQIQLDCTTTCLLLHYWRGPWTGWTTDDSESAIRTKKKKLLLKCESNLHRWHDRKWWVMVTIWGTDMPVITFLSESRSRGHGYITVTRHLTFCDKGRKKNERQVEEEGNKVPELAVV